MGRRRKRKVKRSHLFTGNCKGVKLAMKVTAEDLTRAKIWQLYEENSGIHYQLNKEQRNYLINRLYCCALHRCAQDIVANLALQVASPVSNYATQAPASRLSTQPQSIITPTSAGMSRDQVLDQPS
ncbi:hypothetical protein FRC03_006969 [Tulasnella sp. 419]|nr:hypothetical protein FRC03_006969 [Tulasnella sp. 419]